MNRRSAALLEYIPNSNLEIVNRWSAAQRTSYRYYVVFGQYMAGDSELDGFQGSFLVRSPNNKV
jgi:hypothetical protein